MSIYSTGPITLTHLHTYPLASRKSKVSVRDFAKPPVTNPSLSKFLASLPNFLAAADLRNLLAAIHAARKQRKAILWGIGGHVIKVGLGPVLIDLIQRGFISAIAMNGAALIHDFEIALAGNTSEDVAAYNHRIPVTIHVAIGTDIPHMHRAADGAALGAATHLDFRLFCALVEQMHPGGVYLNWGSAVVLPEVFLKAVSVVRNLGVPLRPITTANFDFIQHYRPLQNVVKRPTAPPARGSPPSKTTASKGYALTGHHEILLPLLAAALVEADRRRPAKAQRSRQGSSKH